MGWFLLKGKREEDNEGNVESLEKLCWGFMCV